MTLPEPARYFPWQRGVYEVTPNMRKLGTDFGNGSQDTALIQLDREFPRYRANKEAAFLDDRSKYVGSDRLSPEVMLAVAEVMALHLSDCYPELYKSVPGGIDFGPTDESIRWTGGGDIGAGTRLAAPFAGLLEALTLVIQPDFAIIQRQNSADRVAGISVCAPSHWRPSEKLGQSFFQTHTVVPGFGRVNMVAEKLVDAIIGQGPFVRFVWGVESDDRLNHHLDAPAGWGDEEWLGRLFDRAPVWVRTERQTLLGLPEVDAALFVIHARTTPIAELGNLTTLAAALESMSPEARRYKGVDTHFESLVAQLR